MSEAIDKAGLIKPGKRPLLHRVGFLLSTAQNERKYKVGRYLETRKRGLGYGPKGKRRRRTGTYTGVYATGVNKSEHVMADAVSELYDVIEKARGGPRSGLIPYGSSHQRKRGEFFSARAKRRGIAITPRQSRAKSYLGERYRGGKGPGGSVRRAFYKSESVEALDGAIEKAKGLIRGGTKRTFRAIARRGKNAAGPTENEWGKRGRQLSPKSRVRNAANYLAGRFTGGYRPGSSRKFSDIRSGRYK